MIQTRIFDYADLTKALRDCAETDCILAVTEYTTLTGETEIIKEMIDMSSMVRPNVFEISVTKEEYEKINEPRLTKDFLAKCLAVSEKLRK